MVYQSFVIYYPSLFDGDSSFHFIALRMTDGTGKCIGGQMVLGGRAAQNHLTTSTQLECLSF